MVIVLLAVGKFVAVEGLCRKCEGFGTSQAGI